MKYLRLHADFLLSPLNIVVMFLATILTVLGILYASDIFQGYAYMDANRVTLSISFMNESFIIFEFVYVFLAIYIGMNLSNRYNQSLMIYTVVSTRTKRQFIIARLVLGVMMIGILLLISCVTLLIILQCLTPYKIQLNLLIRHCFYLYIESTQFYLLTLLIMMIFNHVLMGLLSFIVFWMMEMFVYDGSTGFVSHLEIVFLNIQGYQLFEKNLAIYGFLYIFLCFSYIIFMQKKIVK